jgi:hypothetical protein
LSPQQSQSVLDLPKVIAVGIASPAATVLTSRFGIAGTLLGLALSAVLITVAVDFLKFYLARVPGAVTTIPGGLKKKSPLRKVLERMRLPFPKFTSLPHPRRRSVLIGSVLAALISFLVGLIIVTALELGVGKSLSCWIWQECSTESSAASSSSAGASTLPSVLGGGGQSAPSSIPQKTPLDQQPATSPDTAGASSQEAPTPLLLLTLPHNLASARVLRECRKQKTSNSPLLAVAHQNSSHKVRQKPAARFIRPFRKLARE